MARLAFTLTPLPGGGFHLGREGLDQEVSAESFPSDSLFAALVATLVEVAGLEYAEQFVARWPQAGQAAEPPFLLSSLFPCAGELLLLPMPRLRVELPPKEEHPRTAKLLKNLAYVSPGILARLLAGQPMDDWLPEENTGSNGALLQNSKVWISRGEIALLPANWRNRDGETLKQTHIWQSEPVPRVAIDRLSNRSQIYHVGRTVFADECGLWLLADIERDEDLLETLLGHLADQGIGGERSAGYGAFKPAQTQAPDLPPPDQARRVMTLSRYSPTRAELQAGVLGEAASYELVNVGGWLATPDGPAQRRKRLRLIEAGSVLAAPDSMPIVGQVVNVRPEYPDAPEGELPHPVYRSGVALTIGVTGGD